MSRRDALPRDAWIAATARGMSLTGDGIAYVCLAWRMKEHGTLAVMALTLAMAIPMVLAAPWAGLLADRVSAKRIVTTVTTAQAVVAASLFWTGSGPMTVAALSLLALGTALVNPAWMALLPTLVSEQQLPRAMGLSQSFTAIGNLAGPALGGVLIAAFDTRWPLLLDAGTFMMYAALALALSKDRAPVASGQRKRGWKEMTAGFSVLRTDAIMRTLLLILVVSVFGFAALNVVEIFFITGQLGADSTAYGILGLVYGAGNLGGAQIFPRLRIPKAHLPFAAVMAELVIAIGLLSFAFTRDVWLAAVTLAVAGLGNGVINMVFGLLFANRVPDEVRGRFGSAFGSIITVSSLTSMTLAGMVGTAVAASTVITIGGSLALLAGVAGWPVIARAQRQEMRTAPSVSVVDAEAIARTQA